MELAPNQFLLSLSLATSGDAVLLSKLLDIDSRAVLAAFKSAKSLQERLKLFYELESVALERGVLVGYDSCLLQELRITDNVLGHAELHFLAERFCLYPAELSKFLCSQATEESSMQELATVLYLGDRYKLRQVSQRVLRLKLKDEAEYFEAKEPSVYQNNSIVKKSQKYPPKVSVLCPVYNHERYVSKMLSSIFDQNFEDSIEILITDDESTDQTLDEIRRWQAYFPKIIRIFRFNKNVFSLDRRPMELLLPMARGKYIALCEGDDFFLDPRKFDYQTRILDEHPHVMSVTHNFFRFRTDTLSLTEGYRPAGTILERPDSVRCCNRLFWVHTLMFRNKFDCIPPEWLACGIGDQILTSYLGSFGCNAHISDLFGSLQRLNPFSVWTPMSENEKNCRRFVVKVAIRELNKRLGADRRVIDRCEGIANAIPLSMDVKADLEASFMTRLEKVRTAPLARLEYREVFPDIRA